MKREAGRWHGIRKGIESLYQSKLDSLIDDRILDWAQSYAQVSWKGAEDLLLGSSLELIQEFEVLFSAVCLLGTRFGPVTGWDWMEEGESNQVGITLKHVWRIRRQQASRLRVGKGDGRCGGSAERAGSTRNSGGGGGRGSARSACHLAARNECSRTEPASASASASAGPPSASRNGGGGPWWNGATAGGTTAS